jgi:molecular chaperone HtpG
MSAETLQFKTELKQILDIIIHSLYSHKEIFLRELISNASDAIDTLRFQSLTQPELAEGDTDWKIKIIPDEAAGTLTISDNGIGMSKATIVENLGTIARSGTKQFLEALKQADARDRPELIGQFGVGFYASFMVADKVTVHSRHAGTPASEGVKWESAGQGEFSVEQFDKPTRGTDVILHLRTDERDFLNTWKLRQLVKTYSDYVEHPVVMDVEETEGDEKKTIEETLNARKAIWLRNKSEVTPEEYTEFYKHLTHDAQEPARSIHYAAEGTIEFRALLFIPAHKPFDLMWGESTKGLQLYIRRVFIMDDCEALLPPYLRFVRGVVDSPDLPLNVSRELLQQSAPLEKIKSNLTSKILKTLDELKSEDLAAYASFFREMGIFLKEGVYQDWTNRDALANLLLIESTKTEPGKYTTLAEYLIRMPAGQSEIYFLIGENREMIENAPVLESFKAKGFEVLLLTDPIDEFVTQSLHEFKGKKLKAVDRGEVASDAVPDAVKAENQPLLDFMKEKLPDVKEVRLSTRLKESAACLVADEHAMSVHMERLMNRMGRGGDRPPDKRILELNPYHAAISALRELFANDKDDPRLEPSCRLLYDQALLTEGSRLKDPTAFVRQVNELLVKSISKQ